MTDLKKLRKRHDPENFGEYSNDNYIELFVEAEQQIKALEDYEIMRQGDGFVYSTCKHCGSELNKH